MMTKMTRIFCTVMAIILIAFNGVLPVQADDDEGKSSRPAKVTVSSDRGERGDSGERENRDNGSRERGDSGERENRDNDSREHGIDEDNRSNDHEREERGDRDDKQPSTKPTPTPTPTPTPEPTPEPTVPAAASGLTANAVSETQVGLTWQDNSSDETGFRIESAADAGFMTGKTSLTVAANVTAYSDTGVSSFTSYFYRVYAYNAVGDSASSNVAKVTTLAPPAPIDGSLLYANNCSFCHGLDRTGGIGLNITESALASRTEEWLVTKISSHQTGTALTADEVAALAGWLKGPAPEPTPTPTPTPTPEPTPTPSNQPPVLSVIGDRSVNEGQLLTFPLSANDPDSGTLTYSASNLPSGSSFNATTRVFSWTPSFTQAGSYTAVHFQVSDGALTDSEDITITVANVNRAPVLSAIGNRSVNTGSLLTFTLSATDPDGGTLTYSASNLPSGSSFNAFSRVFSWTPSSTQAGSYTAVHFQVSDGALTDGEDITITVTAGVQLVSFSATIQPMLNQYCNTCHSSTSPRLTTYTQVYSARNNLPGMGASYLTTAQEQALATWISQGALNN